jgi:hypothetical protein
VIAVIGVIGKQAHILKKIGSSALNRYPRLGELSQAREPGEGACAPQHHDP